MNATPLHRLFGISGEAVQGVRVYQKKGAYNRWTKWTPKKERMHTIGCIWLCVSDTKDTPKKERPGQLDQGARSSAGVLHIASDQRNRSSNQNVSSA
jgi:hypothetical protein